MIDLLDELFSEDDLQGPTKVSGILSAIGGDVPRVSDLIDREIRQLDSAEGYGGEIMNGYHPSFLAQVTCVNAYYYSVTLPEDRQVSDPKLFRIFDVGNDVHSRLQRYLQNYLYGTWKCLNCHSLTNVHAGYLDWLERELPEKFKVLSPRVLSSSLAPIMKPAECKECGCSDFRYEEWRVIDEKSGITGKIDGILTNDSGEFVGLEIKSANLASFRSMTPTSPIVQKYSRQFGLYLNALGFSYGVITVECKDNQTLKDFPVNMKALQPVIAPILSAMAYADEVRRGKVSLPTARRIEGCRQCRYYGAPCEPARDTEPS